jgi:D-sedoheptulose 7-phosphate isomerase
MKNVVADILADSIAVKKEFIQDNDARIVAAAKTVASALSNGHKVLLFGNGGSAADAQHLAAEFVNRFRIERPPLAAIALTTDTSIITSIGNDYHFDDIFAKQIRAIGQVGDVAIGISTSGNSPNVVRAIEAAKEMDLITVGLAGRGGELAKVAETCFKVKSDTTARVQEAHIIWGHMLCDLVDRILFPDQFQNGE